MEPDVLVQGKESYLRPDPSQDVAAHGKHNEQSIKGQDQSCTTRHPDRESQGVQARKLDIRFLEIPALLISNHFPRASSHSPSQGKYTPVTSPEHNIEQQLRPRQLPRKPRSF